MRFKRNEISAGNCFGDFLFMQKDKYKSSGRRGYSPQMDISSEFEYEISELRMRFFFGKYFQYFISRVMFSLGTTMILAERGLSEVKCDPYSRLSIENSSNYLHLLLD